jgi:hypothetical protein
VDSGPLIAAVDARDTDHAAVVATLTDSRYELIVPALCVAEAAYLVAVKYGPVIEAAFLRGLAVLDVQAPHPDDWARIADLVERYRDFPLGATDASVVALAERLNTDLVVTLDRRHFGAVRPAHCAAFRLLPEPG